MERKISKELVRLIKDTFIITRHCKKRILERMYEDSPSPTGKELYEMIAYDLENNFIAYRNVDNSINIAVNLYEYYVIVYDKRLEKYVIITFKERSHNDITILDKYEMAKQGIRRRK